MPEQLLAEVQAALEKFAAAVPEGAELLAHFQDIVSGGGKKEEPPMPGNMPMEAGVAKVKPAL